jgi:membrane protein DedA with SNARE-associated domain
MDIRYDSYHAIFLGLLLSTTVLPVPEELPVFAAGVLCGHSDAKFADDRGNPERLRWSIMLPVVIAGAVLGDVVLYAIGRVWGKKLLDLRWVKRRLLPPEKRAKIEKNFADRGIIVLLGVRLLPGVRGPVFLIAGMVRLPLWQFLLADFIYAIPIVNVMFWTAYWLTDQILVLLEEVERYRSLIASHVLAAVAGALVYRYLIGRHVPTGEPTPLVEKAEATVHAIESALESAVEVVTGRHHHDHEHGQAHKHDHRHRHDDGPAVPADQAKARDDDRAQTPDNDERKSDDRPPQPNSQTATTARADPGAPPGAAPGAERPHS